MLKRYIWLAVAAVFFTFQLFVSSAFAIELDEASRTVKANEAGDTVVLTLQQAKQGRRIFSNVCSQCHMGGITKTDFNVGLSTEDLAGAYPPRDNLEALVEYIKHPMTYDGEVSIAELHPSIESADIFPEMRNLTEDDLTALAGHILSQPNILGDAWGGGKALR